jgi:hypothetical protein
MGILDQIVGNAGNTGQPRRGLLGAVGGAQGLLQNPATMDLGLALLANSGYSSRRRGFGEILGTSMLQSRQMAAEAAQQKLREQYMQAQIQAMNAPGATPQRRIVRGPDGLDYYEDGTRVLPNVQAPAAMPRPRESREINVGNMVRTEEFNPETGKWESLATSPRWPSPSPAAVVNNYPGVTAGPELPKLGPGEYRPDPTKPGVEVEPGSARDLENKAAAEKAKAAAQSRILKARSVISTVDRAINSINAKTAGAGGALMRNLPGTGAVDLASDIETITANLSFDELANMRAQSTSGGALGAIAVRELDLLGSTVASLKQEQSPPRLRENMQKIRYHYDRWLLAVEGKDPDKAGMGPRETGAAPQGKRVRVDANGNVRP